MQTAALIVAAGMSSRMGDFKPMLNIGSISIAQRIIATLQQAGVTRIVMVTGYNAVKLERHLSNNGIVFLRNEKYESTQMFDSAKIGLDYLKDKCDRILFMPVDIPLFTASTVTRLLETDAELAIPVCNGTIGHPIILSASLAEKLLTDTGEGGMKGALGRCSAPPLELAVTDAGVLHDADTPEDFEKLLKYHNDQLVRQIVSVSLAREKVFFDERTAMLLHLIDETASVRTACQRMQISYSSGWNIIRTLESQVSYPLLCRTQGGSNGGQSHLTERGKQLVEVYDRFKEELTDNVTELFARYFDGVL